jgi:cation diffusion facilitator family transporter
MKNLTILLNAGQYDNPNAVKDQRFAMNLSVATGLLMLFGKSYAFLITGSMAILSDAAESIVHIFAVGFAAYSLHLSRRPPDKTHPYGHEKISYFSAGMEGGLIIIAALFIMFSAISKWMSGLALQNLSTGTIYTGLAAAINGWLGLYLLHKGKKTGSLILVANGKHVLTDVWTSLGVIIGLMLVLLTGRLEFDPIAALLAASNILWTGARLIRQSVGGLMDEGDPELEAAITRALEEESALHNVSFHKLRYRTIGTSLWVDVHLLFPGGMVLDEAHRIASEIEGAVHKKLPVSMYFVTHLEPIEEHDEAHERAEAPHR